MDTRTVTDEICRMEPDAASVERVIVRALGIPLACDAPAAGHPGPRFWKRIPSWTKAPRMRRRLAYGGVGIAAALTFFVLWATVSTASLSAMEKMAEKIREAKSFKATIIGELRETGEPQVVATGTVYWLAPGSCREELKRPRQGELHEEDSVDISPAGKTGIFINHLTKEFQRPPAHLGPESPLRMFDQLSRFSGDADGKLGEKNVGGAKAWGFEIDARKIDPDSEESTVEIWIEHRPGSETLRGRTAGGLSRSDGGLPIARKTAATALVGLPNLCRIVRKISCRHKNHQQ